LGAGGRGGLGRGLRPVPLGARLRPVALAARPAAGGRAGPGTSWTGIYCCSYVS